METRFARCHVSSRCWLAVLLAYTVIFGGLLLKTGGYPYVFDNNESFSNLWHSRSLYENGLAQTKGLTDEVFAHHAAASPYVHTHQGNFPRLFTFLLYVLGLRSVESQLWVTTFTIGLAGFYFAFRYLSIVGTPLFATIACLVFMTDYLLLVEYHANLYHVWHLFFFFSSLLCVQRLGEPGVGRRWWWLLLLNFFCLSYWEYVFTSFVSILAALYALALYHRRWRLVAGIWLGIGIGAAAAGGILFVQLLAYMGWAGIREDVHLTLTARNSAGNPELFRAVADFYSRHHIIFWHNFQDISQRRSFQGFVDVIFGEHLIVYTPELAAALLLVGAGWLLGFLRWPNSLGARHPAAPSQASRWRRRHFAREILVFSVMVWAIGRMLLSIWTAFMAEPGSLGEFFWLADVPLVLLLGRAWTGTWWGWLRLRIFSVLLSAAYAEAIHAFLQLQPRLYDAGFRALWHEAAGDDGAGWRPCLLVLSGALSGLSLVALGNRAILGPEGRSNGARLARLFGCCLAAYAAAFVIFTGYIQSGYVVRHVPFFVFLTDLLLALALYVPLRVIQGSVRGARSLVRRSVLLAAAGSLLLFGWSWLDLQARLVAIAPPDNYAFLKLLKQPQFQRHSVVTNGYPAPMAWTMGSWGYAESAIFSGMLTLTPGGFASAHDYKYLWLADRATNPGYAKPDFGLIVDQPTNLSQALRHRLEQQNPGLALEADVLATGLVRRSREDFQPFLQHRLVASEARHYAILKFDWDFPPYLRPVDGELMASFAPLPLRQRLAYSDFAQETKQRWRIEFEPLPPGPGPAGGSAPIVLLNATADGRPVFSPAALEAAGWAPDREGHAAFQFPGGRATRGRLSALASGKLLRLRLLESPQAGRIQITVNDTAQLFDLRSAETKPREIVLSSTRPFGQFTSIPSFQPGLYVRTSVLRVKGRGTANVDYEYAHQEGRSEDATTLRIYHENEPDRWELLDAITFLGSRSIPVRLAEFQQANPDAVREYARIAARGDLRSFPHWLADHLTANPGQMRRPGIVQEAWGSPILPGPSPSPIAHRRVPLPDVSEGAFQISVVPATWTKAGPEYFGLTFPAAGLSRRAHAEPQKIVMQPPRYDPDARLQYGVLRLRLRFPAHRFSQAEPIVSTGLEEAGDFVYVFYQDEAHIQLSLDHWFTGGPTTGPIPIDYGAVHELEISLGSLFPPADDVTFVGVPPAAVQDLKKTVRIKLDGKTVLDSPADFYESPRSLVTVGRNTINGTTSGPVFTGKILAADRFWPSPPPAPPGS